MKKLIKFLSFPLFFFGALLSSKDSKAVCEKTVSDRVNKIRSALKDEIIKDNETKLPAEDFGSNFPIEQWGNWGNWGNWNNWNNWAKWNDWYNWGNWGNWRNI